MQPGHPLMGNNTASVDWLLNHIDDRNVVVFDCRCDISDPSAGRKMYDEGHIPGSYFLDMEKDLSGPKGRHGGRHPLPDPVQFSIMMGKTGVDREKTVVAYDELGFAASRLWWLLKYYGHDQVVVLEGGYREWIKKGGKISKEIPDHVSTMFIPDIRHYMVYSRNDLRKNLGNITLIDSRSYERYTGRKEPIDFRAGHIPGAINIDFTGTFSAPSVWKSEGELKDIYRDIEGIPVVYCGSGVTATASIMALAKCGKPSVLYAGSWSDWITYDDAEVETGDPYGRGESFSQ